MDTRKLRIKKEPIDLENLSLPDLDERKCLIKKELKTNIYSSDGVNCMKNWAEEMPEMIDKMEHLAKGASIVHEAKLA